MKSSLTIMYVIREMLRSVKNEMDEKGLTFDEFLEYYDDAVKVLEQAREVM